jgi:acetyltransferase-like isoleucine patch superfamily enzyme
MTNKLIIIFYVLKNMFIFKSLKGVVYGKKLRIRGSVKLFIDKGGSLTVGNNFTLISGLMLNPLGRNIKSSIRVDANAEIIIGDDVGMSCVSLWAKKKILIGDNVKLGADVIIMDSDMHTLDYLLRRNVDTDGINAKSSPIIIGDDVFVGTRSIITKGVSIGNRSIVAAGSVVSKSIPQDEIWGGNPAKFIKKIT